MSLFIDDDLPNFFDEEEFAIKVSNLTRGVSFLAIFEDPVTGSILRSDGKSKLSMALEKPVLFMQSHDLSKISKGDHLKIGGKDYYAFLPQPDGTGLIKVELYDELVVNNDNPNEHGWR